MRKKAEEFHLTKRLREVGKYGLWVVLNAGYDRPISVLNASGEDNVITTQYNATSGTNSQISDDALTVSLSPTSAQPSITGWNDYTFITSGTTTPANDAVPNP